MATTYAVGLLVRPGPYQAGVGGKWWTIDPPNGDGITPRWSAAQIGATALYTVTPADNSPAEVGTARNSLIASWLAGSGDALVLLDSWYRPIRSYSSIWATSATSGEGPASDVADVCGKCIAYLNVGVGLMGGAVLGYSADLDQSHDRSHFLVGGYGGTVVQRVIAGTAAPSAAAVFSTFTSWPTRLNDGRARAKGQLQVESKQFASNGFTSLSLAAIDRGAMNLAAMTAFAPNWCVPSVSGSFTRHPDQTFGARMNAAGRFILTRSEINSAGPLPNLDVDTLTRADGFT